MKLFVLVLQLCILSSFTCIVDSYNSWWSSSSTLSCIIPALLSGFVVPTASAATPPNSSSNNRKSSGRSTASTRTSGSLSTRNTHVIQLTDENFEHLTQASTGQTTGRWFVNFSSPKCPHCMKLYPIWKDLADRLKSDPESSVMIAMVDTTKNPKLVNRFQIKAMPTLYYFANGGMYHYAPRRPRNVEDFVSFVMEEYLEEDVKAVPTAPRGMSILVETWRRKLHDMEGVNVFLKDLENIFLYRKNAAALLFGLGVIVGVLFMMTVAKIRRSFAADTEAEYDDKKSKKE